jgi:hypothetical protein
LLYKSSINVAPPGSVQDPTPSVSCPARRLWLDRLIACYLETGPGTKLDRVAAAITAMEALSAFLDDVSGGGESVRSRLAAEGVSSL